MDRIGLVFEPPGPPPAAVVDMACELGQDLGAEVLVACAVEWHPRYGGPETGPAEDAVGEVVDRLSARGVAARGEVARVLAGDGPRVLADDVAEFGAGLLIVAERRLPALLRALGLGLAGRLARRSRVPVVLLPWRGWPRRPRTAPALRVLR
jgi:nucleotide-binding universal stress UspA family protein